MSVDIKVPSLGESVVEATVAKWYKNEGDSVTTVSYTHLTLPTICSV